MLLKQAHISLVLKPLVVQRTPMNQGDDPVRDSWACEHFQLTSETVQVKLRKYLQLPQIQQEMPEALNTEAAQLLWMTEFASKELSEWVASFLDHLKDNDIMSGHSQVNTAAELVEAFRFSSGNAIAAWADALRSDENMKTLLRHLQLTPVQCNSANAAIAHSILQAASAEPVDPRSELFASKLLVQDGSLVSALVNDKVGHV